MTAAFVWRLLVAVAIAAVGWIVAGQVARIVQESLEGTPLDPRVRAGLVRAVRPVVGLIAIVAALQYLDIDLSTVAAMAGAVTLAIGFTLQPALSNLATGALLLTLRPFREGDWIECANGEHGTVVEQGTFALVLRRLDGVVVTVPNNIAFAHPIRNHTRLGQRRVEVTFVLDHDADLELARTSVMGAARSDEHLLADPEPLILIAVEDRGVRLTVRAWTEATGWPVAASSLAERAHGALKLAGVPFAPVPALSGPVTR